MIESILEYDYSDVHVEDLQNKGTIDTKKIFINPFGFCMKMKNFEASTVLEIKSTKRMKVMYVDGNFADNVRVSASGDATVEVEKAHGSFCGKYYKITYQVADNSR